jgi:predicted Fe-Mo cluster-binding NifX family protein
MKIAIPVVNSSDHKYDIAPGFNVTPYFCIYDTGQGEYFWMHTDEVLNNGENIVTYFRKQNLGIIITSMMKPMALKLFNRMGISVYKSEIGDLRENIESFKMEKLSQYTTEEAVASSNACGGECSACDTTCDSKESN